jgi:hypothetical protein
VVYNGERKGDAFYSYVKNDLLGGAAQICEPSTRKHCSAEEVAKLDSFQGMPVNALKIELRSIREEMAKRTKAVEAEKAALQKVRPCK